MSVPDDLEHPLLNKRVRVILARKGESVVSQIDLDDISPTLLVYHEDVYIVGKLIRINPDGDFDIRLDDGRMRYCWPALEITEEEE